MAYDEDLAERLRDQFADKRAVTEKKMFGGYAFLINGHMAAAAGGQGGLLLRCPPERTDALSEQPHASAFVMRGRELVGWLRIEPEGIASDADLARWVAIGQDYVATLPPKQP